MPSLSPFSTRLVAVGLSIAASGAGCALGGNGSGFRDHPGGGGSGGSGGSGGEPGGDGGLALASDSGDPGSTAVKTTIYANSDTSLYSIDPTTKAITAIGTFAGQGGDTITDVAVNAAGDVYVNSESAVYKATVPATPGSVALTRVASIAAGSSQYFYALAFAPPGVLGSGETLVGGDGNGELWSIDPSSGATQDLGHFGPDPHDSSRILGLSGDVVFYFDSSHNPTGLATIRSCYSDGSSCDKTNDYLAAIDMAALVGAYTGHAPAASLLAGIYGGSSGSGTGYGELFGLAAWEGQVYAFSRASSGGPPPQLVLIDTSTGAGSVAASSPGFTSGGWSGAGVSTLTAIAVPPPTK